MSYQDVRGFYEERDDEPEPDRAPEGVKPGERFMEKGPHGRYDVCDWDEEQCECCDPCDGRPSQSCPECQGKGWVYTVPVVTYTDMEANDARLLVHGDKLIQACVESLKAINNHSAEPIPVGVHSHIARLLSTALMQADRP